VALAIRKEQADDHLTVSLFRSRLADSDSILGHVLQDRGRSAEAER
jgi:hypothetical protein